VEAVPSEYEKQERLARFRKYRIGMIPTSFTDVVNRTESFHEYQPCGSGHVELWGRPVGANPDELRPGFPLPRLFRRFLRSPSTTRRSRFDRKSQAHIVLA